MGNDPFSSAFAPDTEAMTGFLREFTSSFRPEVLGDRTYPRVTIVTPSLNQAAFLERTILSVLNQGYPNLEYLVIDGGSTDGSREIIKKYEKHLSYWVSEPDEGQSQAINKGLRRATGEWVAFQNSDDVFLPGAFKAFAEAFEKNPDAEALYGDILLIDSEDQVEEVWLTAPTRFWLQVAFPGQVHNQALFWRRSLLDRIGFLREDLHFCFDYEYFLRILAFTSKVRHIDRYLGAFRRHAAAKTSTIPQVAREETAKVIKEYGGPAHVLQRLAARIIKAHWYLLNGKGWYVFRKK